MEDKIVLCPDCQEELKLMHSFETDWYGKLTYYWCVSCEVEFVTRDDGEPEYAPLY
jgi:hypothetical protein